MSPSTNALARSLPPELGSLARASELRSAGAGALAWRLGWPELDELLGGVPRGQLSEWAGPRSAGKTAALRRLVATVLEAGAGAAYVDGAGTLTPAAWIQGRLGPGAGAAPFWVVRPPEPAGVLAATDELVRSGAFGLVIAEGADWSRVPAVRLQRLARDTGAALVAVVARAGKVPLAGLRVQFASEPGSRVYRVRVRGQRAREVSYAQELPYRLPGDSGSADRRGLESEPRYRP
ncbi:MAG: hypothetical protein GWN99_05060 [Gemmatimonadetes bacterium]|uniref:RecA-like N-terminal domain-containing protein n=1 Tax=Candidatus Kutchimonas denitrificans TaxID=3056748 RepID=A0AAE4ZA04_9BACT|nr:hypothetical protein [Gemmatimonadota bacterium]NIR76054.1 hypothetical protein [Candidatus Kutchimonas denitrificans]NIS00433.1 hypothetical protein [Gemmatimonadota bacterium]NIT66091.1 hypothetical protein [Gemmatimonadota bacterium]NIU54169.1 hypothetical protein [Gemmatimonadota bacterium]